MEEIQARSELVEAMKFFHSKSWTPGTGGNFSSVLTCEPLTLLMSPSGTNKGEIDAAELVVVNSDGLVVSGQGTASAETPLHLAIIKTLGVSSVLHIHSVYNTLISRKYAGRKGLRISGFEMLKSLEGNESPLCEEWIPIIPNNQNMGELSKVVEDLLLTSPSCKGILLDGHGLYSWGRTVFSARRHIEGLEFLFEVIWREQHSS